MAHPRYLRRGTLRHLLAVVLVSVVAFGLIVSQLGDGLLGRCVLAVALVLILLESRRRFRRRWQRDAYN